MVNSVRLGGSWPPGGAVAVRAGTADFDGPLRDATPAVFAPIFEGRAGAVGRVLTGGGGHD